MVNPALTRSIRRFMTGCAALRRSPSPRSARLRHSLLRPPDLLRPSAQPSASKKLFA